MTDLKKAIRDHFKGNYTRFFQHFHPDLALDGDKATVLCSTHDDHDPNRDLVLRGEKAGSHFCQVCEAGGDALSYYAMKTGLDPKTQFPQVLEGIVSDFGIKVSTNGQVKQRVVATFDYTDEAGNLLYQIQRKEPGKELRSKKDFVIRRPDGNGGWIYDGKGIEFVLYLLHDLTKTKGQHRIVVVEGEGKADLLWRMGIRATCNPFGAGKWKKGYSAYLADEDVILWPDKDSAGLEHMKKVAVSLQSHARSVRLVPPPEELPPKGDVIDVVKELGWQREDLERILAGAEAWEPAENRATDESGDDGDTQEKAQSESQASRLAKLVCDDTELFYDQHQTPHALVGVADHYQVLRCRSQAFKRWMVRQMYVAEDRVPGSEAITGALNLIEALAVYEGDQHQLRNRVAANNGDYWYDLTDEKSRAIRINSEGWEIVDNPPILFSRYDHHAPQVEPIPGGDIQRLFDFLPISDEDTRLLLLSWLVSCLVPDIPHPIPVFHGPQGSGKSSTCRILRRLIDPSSLETLSFPRDHNELVQKLAHHYVALFDNIDTLQPWQSDMLCRACTGEGFSKRQLFSDDDDIIYSFRRCVGLNGINITATRADLLDRSILIPLERISSTQRREEDELEAAFVAARPHILGGIFDVFSRAILIRPSVKLASKPRMADFARWGWAIAQALGFEPVDFQRAYSANIEEQNAEVLVGHPVAAAVRILMKGASQWEGEPGQLLEKLEGVADEAKIDRKDRLWPKGSNWLTRRLKEVKPNLAAVGIQIDTGHSGRNFIRIHKESENTVPYRPCGSE